MIRFGVGEVKRRRFNAETAGIAEKILQEDLRDPRGLCVRSRPFE
jgi:hypothetical protein